MRYNELLQYVLFYSVFIVHILQCLYDLGWNTHIHLHVISGCAKKLKYQWAGFVSHRQCQGHILTSNLLWDKS
jgi:hypothetical protein